VKIEFSCFLHQPDIAVDPMVANSGRPASSVKAVGRRRRGPNARLAFTIPSIDSPGYQNVTIKIILPAEVLVKLG
jgi:hypothetical protein